jgi:two-component system sensor histidine kinase PilS (NtrC family)
LSPCIFPSSRWQPPWVVSPRHMIETNRKISREELSSRLQILMFLRLLVVSFLLGASLFIQVKQTRTYFGDIQTSHYVLLSTIYFLTFIYVILLKTLKDLEKLAYMQLLVDTFFVTAVVYTTGGINSIFSFLYFLTIINGSIILYRKGGMTVASSCSILYGLLIDLHYYGVIHPLGGGLGEPFEYDNVYIFYMIVVNIAAFYLIAFLSSYPSEQMRKSRIELQAKQDDIVKLEALNEWIICSITSGLIALDGQNRVILFNPAAVEIFGVELEQTTGRNVLEALPFIEEYLANSKETMDFKNKKGNPYIDLPYLRPDGRRLFLRFSISPLKIPEGEQKGQILIFQDMTAVKRIEEEMKRVEGLAMIGELAAGIAHEVRNPMASISGSIQMLKEGLSKDEVSSRLMDIVLREVNRLNNLVNDFLLFARPKPPNLQKFDLNQLIMDSLELFRNTEKWRTKIEVETNFHEPVNIESDPEQIKQVLLNLFVNASEAMPGGGSLNITTDMVELEDGLEPEQEMAKITIHDTGEGFSDTALRQLFTPFFTTKDGGTGLGLAIVKRIVEGLKGRVSGRSHPEGGAEITIVLHPCLEVGAR